jgi:hypothetical protein
MHDDQTSRTPNGSRPPAGGKVKRLFESPYRIDSPEAPANLSAIGNGRGPLIDEAIAELIREIPEGAVVRREDLDAAAED